MSPGLSLSFFFFFFLLHINSTINSRPRQTQQLAETDITSGRDRHDNWPRQTHVFKLTGKHFLFALAAHPLHVSAEILDSTHIPYIRVTHPTRDGCACMKDFSPFPPPSHLLFSSSLLLCLYMSLTCCPCFHIALCVYLDWFEMSSFCSECCHFVLCKSSPCVICILHLVLHIPTFL